MATIEQASRVRAERSFVGRERELALFRGWFDAGAPEILSVAGPGGVGKSTLLAAFARIAAGAGRPVLLVDGRTVLPTREGLMAALVPATRPSAWCATRGVVFATDGRADQCNLRVRTCLSSRAASGERKGTADQEAGCSANHGCG